MCAAFIFYSQPNDFGCFAQFRPSTDMIRYGSNNPILAESAQSGANRCESVRVGESTWQDAAQRGTDARSTASLPRRHVERGCDGSGAASVHPRFTSMVSSSQFQF